MKLAVVALLLGFAIPGCAPKEPPAYFMAKELTTVHDTAFGERLTYQPGETAVLLAGGKEYAGKSAYVEYWARGGKIGQTNTGAIPTKGASAWRMDFGWLGTINPGQSVAVTAKLFVEGKPAKELTITVGK